MTARAPRPRRAARRLYLTGADGMLGTALTAALAADPRTADWSVRGVSRDDFDIADGAAVRRSVDAHRPDVVVHAAAHAVVDDCERDPALALAVNVAGVHHVVDACRRHGSRLLYVSSDYVFDGDRPPAGGYGENDVPNPRSLYGLTKLAGERTTALLGGNGLAVRTSWLFGGTDERVDPLVAALRRGAAGESVPLVADQYSRPTYTVDLAAALVHLLTAAASAHGTVHVANEGRASWYDVGLALRALRPDLPAPRPVPMADCGFVGGRPRDSTLSTARLAALGWRMPTWDDALRRFCAAYARPPAPAGAR